MAQLATASDVIDALGGDMAVAERYERTPQAVRNWRYGRGIPPGLRPLVDADLRKHGKHSAPSVYSTYQPRDLKLPGRKIRGSRRPGTLNKNL